MEIERKYLIEKEQLPADLASYPFHKIEQGYLCTSPVVRIRRQDDNYFLTYKSKGLMAREEYNLPLLASIPIDPGVGEACDNGAPFVHSYGKTETAKIFNSVAEKIMNLE